MVAQWGRYEDALGGAPVFAVSFNSRYERWDTLKGNVASGAVRRAVVQGTSYGWNDNTVGLLWQTHKDSRSAQGWSGSVLCLEQPGQGVKLVLFQNYQEIC